MNHKRSLVWSLSLLLLGLAVFVSCVQEDPSKFRKSIPGIWVSPEGAYYTFQRGGSAMVQGITPAEDGGTVWGSSYLSYQVNCCSMQIKGNWPGIDPLPKGVYLHREMDLLEMNDSLMSFRNLSYQVDNQEVVTTTQETWFRVTEGRFVDSLIGTWESVFVSDVANRTLRLQFKKASAYDCYRFVSNEDTLGWIRQEQPNATWYNLNNQLVLNTFDNELMGQPALPAVLSAELLMIEPTGTQLMDWATATGNWRFRRITEAD